MQVVYIDKQYLRYWGIMFRIQKLQIKEGKIIWICTYIHYSADIGIHIYSMYVLLQLTSPDVVCVFNNEPIVELFSLWISWTVCYDKLPAKPNYFWCEQLSAAYFLLLTSWGLYLVLFANKKKRLLQCTNIPSWTDNRNSFVFYLFSHMQT